MGSIPTEAKIFFSLPRVIPWFPLLGLTPSGLFMGSISALIYTSELILFSFPWELLVLCIVPGIVAGGIVLASETIKHLTVAIFNTKCMHTTQEYLI